MPLRPPSRWLPLALTGLLALGACASPLPPRRAELPFEPCGMERMLISHASEAEGMNRRDAKLGDYIGRLMQRAFEAGGMEVVEDPRDAYWSLMVLATNDARHDGGFIFSATLSLRQLNEGGDSGVSGYRRADGREGTPTLYTALSYGPSREMERLVDQFVERAQEELDPAMAQICTQLEQTRGRERSIEEALPSAL